MMCGLRMTVVRCLVGSVLMVGLLGCDQSDLDAKLFPVSGTVTLDDQPLANASVVFLAGEGVPGSGARGTTDAEGKYTLTTSHGGPGAAVGSYTVVINKIVMADGSPIPPGTTSIAELQTKDIVPPLYTNPSNSPLKATVSENSPPIDFQLKSK